jgi:hypothetical protein
MFNVLARIVFVARVFPIMGTSNDFVFGNRPRIYPGKTFEKQNLF